jgi:hypothetical protein
MYVCVKEEAIYRENAEIPKYLNVASPVAVCYDEKSQE